MARFSLYLKAGTWEIAPVALRLCRQTQHMICNLARTQHGLGAIFVATGGRTSLAADSSPCGQPGRRALIAPEVEDNGARAFQARANRHLRAKAIATASPDQLTASKPQA